jgi:hypothetical protein
MKAMLSRHSASIVGWPCLGVCSPKHTLRHGRICACRLLVYFDEVHGRGVAERRRNAASERLTGSRRAMCGGRTGTMRASTALGGCLGGWRRRLGGHAGTSYGVLLEGRVHRYGCGCGCGYGHGWVKEIKRSRGWLTKDAFLMIVGAWFLFVFLLALNHRRI